MKPKSCRVCGHSSREPLFSALILENYLADYFDCAYCGYVQTSDPTWLAKAYEESINKSDTGILARNLSNVSVVLATLMLLGARSERVIDYAGGYGILVRLLRDVGVDAYWDDPHSVNLVARGFESPPTKGGGLVTAFEAFEHFENPITEMEKIIKLSPNILFSTILIGSPAPKPTAWWYYGLEHGQHIGFFRLKTLQYLAKKFNLHLISDGSSIHFLSERKWSYTKWKILLRVAMRVPVLFKVGLISKIWSDHLTMKENSREKFPP